MFLTFGKKKTFHTQVSPPPVKSIRLSKIFCLTYVTDALGLFPCLLVFNAL